jgi:hypothetical protein
VVTEREKNKRQRRRKVGKRSRNIDRMKLGLPEKENDGS